MPEVNIKLGMKSEGYPSNPVSVGSHEFFPTLRLENVEGLDLPKEGGICLKYRLTRDTKETRDGKEVRSVELDILEICEVESKETETEEESTEDILKRLKDSLESK